MAAVTKKFSPTVRRRRLGAEMRRHREAAGFTLEQAAKHVDSSHSRLSRIETAQLGIRPPDLRALLELYKVAPEEREKLVALAREARQRGWWHVYRDTVPEWFEVYMGLESEAAGLGIYDSQFVVGLLQTEEYARALYKAAIPPRSESDIAGHIKLRMERQTLVTEQVLRLRVVLDESVVRRTIGGREVLLGQLRRLLEVAELPNVSLQILPFDAGAVVLSPFTILDFPDPEDPSVIYIEHQAGASYAERPAEVRNCSLIFDSLRAAAWSPAQSAQFIADLVREMT